MTHADRKTLAKYWLNGSLKDLEAAQHLILKAKLYPQGLFFLHLSIEKYLKGIFILKFGIHAPFSHNLMSLIEKCKLSPTKEFLTTLSIINEFNLSTRYPDEKAELKKRFNATFAKKHLKLGLSIHTWLSKENNLLP